MRKRFTPFSNLTTVWAMSKALTKRYFRDKVALFFTFLFPLIFLLVFGTIFGGSNEVSLKVVLINKSDSAFATDFVNQTKKAEIFKIDKTTNFDEAKQKLERSEIDAIIELPKGFGDIDTKTKYPAGTVTAFYDQGDQQLAATFTAVLQGTLDNINSKFVKVDEPIKLQAKALQTANLSRFDYTLPGLIGFSILSLGVFSMSEGFTGDKKAGALRRMQVAPIKSWHLIVATGVNRVLVGVLSVALLFVVALTVFDFNMRGDYFSFLIFTIIGTICLFGFGMAIGGWAKDSNQAAPLSNLVSFPMMFLSGVFFPVFLMPEWLQGVTVFIPLTPVVEGLRLILTEGRTIFELGPQLAIIGCWTIIIYVIAFRLFRWE